MRCAAFFIVASPLLASAFNVIVSNDDGWAEQNVRTFVKTLTTAGFAAVLSSPAENQSGTSSSDTPPKTVGSSGCQFGSCPAGSPATGFNASDTKLNYVNSYPVTAIRYGINTLAPNSPRPCSHLALSLTCLPTSISTSTSLLRAAHLALPLQTSASCFRGSTLLCRF